MHQGNMAPEPVARIYMKVLSDAIINLRYRIRSGEVIDALEIHDFLDALHNIPQMICDYRSAGGWFSEKNIDADLESYDAKWHAKGDSELRRSLLNFLKNAKSEVEGAEF